MIARFFAVSHIAVDLGREEAAGIGEIIGGSQAAPIHDRRLGGHISGPGDGLR
jgi:hypothetical protein